MSTMPPDGADAPSDLPVRLLRADHESEFDLRFLQHELSGMLTHWNGDTSERCWPDRCDRCHKRLRAYWKGYAAAEIWRPINRDWYPVVFEATEALEQVMRGEDLLGTIWHISRGARQGKKPIPVSGRQVGAHVLPEDFQAHEIKPVLLSIYGPGPLYLGKANPLPPKVYAKPSKAAAPPIPESERERDERLKREAAQAAKTVGPLGASFADRGRVPTLAADKPEPILAPELKHLANGIGGKL